MLTASRNNASRRRRVSSTHTVGGTKREATGVLDKKVHPITNCVKVFKNSESVRSLCSSIIMPTHVANKSKPTYNEMAVLAAALE